ncbi:MAG: TIM barrel protein, partial [Bacteroidetes bacterium]|nr:TIM barrel protein [Bacteroidota bacterium]
KPTRWRSRRNSGGRQAFILGALPESHLRGRINHSVCKWCYPDYSVEELAQAAATMGLKSVELLEPDEWPILEKYGLVCAMPFGPVADGKDRLTDGFNEPTNHEWLVPMFIERIREVAEAGYDRVICFSGNRRGMEDAKGLENCVQGLKKIVPVAEQHGVTLCMELLNSKVSHPDYMCDHTVWGVELCKQIGSEYFKLLYDIYHMQVMEGDVIRTIRDNHQFIGHYHTGGNPGRNEIDDSQELNYPAIMRAIVETGYTGFVGQEFIPTRTPLISLREAVRLCDV